MYKNPTDYFMHLTSDPKTAALLTDAYTDRVRSSRMLHCQTRPRVQRSQRMPWVVRSMSNVVL